MAKQINVGVGGVKRTSKVRAGVGGVVKTITKGVAGVGGVVKEFYGGEKIFEDDYDYEYVGLSTYNGYLNVKPNMGGSTGHLYIYGDFAGKTYSITIRAYEESVDIMPSDSSGTHLGGFISFNTGSDVTKTGTFKDGVACLHFRQYEPEENQANFYLKSIIIDGEERLEELKTLLFN